MEELLVNLESIVQQYAQNEFYIGQTNNPKIRLKQHYNSKKFLFMIVIYESTKEIIDIIEYSLINKFQDYETNMNNQVYPDNDKLKNLKSIVIPKVKDIEDKDKHYVYIAFPFIVEVNGNFIDALAPIDTLKVEVQENEKIKVSSSLSYTINKKENRNPQDICEDKINTLINQYKYKYKYIKIRSTNENFKIFKANNETKKCLIKMVYKNSNTELIKSLKKHFNDIRYVDIENIKEGRFKRLVNSFCKDDKLYVKFYNG